MDDDAVKQAVSQTRSELEAEFEPRAERALTQWPVDLSERDIGGVSCQIVEPQDIEAQGTVLYLFGGGYVSGSPETELPITTVMACLGKVRIVLPRYSLAPENPFPIGLNQCFAVYEALTADSGEHPLFISGESAGGGMALAVTRMAVSAGIKTPKRLALFSPWSDLTSEGIAKSEGIDDPTITTTDLLTYVQAYLKETPAHNPLASPGITQFPAGWPDTILTTGSRDILHPSVIEVAQAMGETGANIKLIDIPGAYHVFEIYDELPEAMPSLRVHVAIRV